MLSNKISASLMDSIYLKLAELAKKSCVIRSGAVTLKIPVIKYAENSFIFFFIDSEEQCAINLNQRLYDFFTSRGIWPDLEGGYFIVSELTLLMEAIDSQYSGDKKFKSSTAQSS
jgi:hypothetical protein